MVFKIYNCIIFLTHVLYYKINNHYKEQLHNEMTMNYTHYFKSVHKLH